MKKKKEKSGKAKTALQSPKGMRDILPEEQPFWEKTRKAAADIADFYNFSRIDTPILEFSDIFEKAVGEATDIVEKQMFVLRTKGGDRLALRPEGTAGIMRAYFEHGLSRLSQPLKLYYLGPMFRYEHPQAGRHRQFHQVGFEIIGSEDAIYDIQIILATTRFLEELKIKNQVIQINSIGCKKCRPGYRKKLQDYYQSQKNKICDDCRRRLEINPLRLLDCKSEKCAEIKGRAPTTVDYLCVACRTHFKSVLEYFDDLNLPYILNSHLVRGLDYYNRTVFEIFTDGSDIALAGGGRYDYLGAILGARQKEVFAVGSALGMERIVETMKAQNLGGPAKSRPKIFLVQIGEAAKKRTLLLMEEFKKSDIKVIEAFGKESFKSQLKAADKERALLSLIMGQREVFEDSVIIRNMQTGVQETVPLNKAVEEAKKRLKNSH